MPDAQRPDLEARICAEEDRAVAPYEGVAPPFIVAKLRELAKRYWRESPVAARALQLQGCLALTPGGEVATTPEEEAKGA